MSTTNAQTAKAKYVFEKCKQKLYFQQGCAKELSEQLEVTTVFSYMVNKLSECTIIQKLQLLHSNDAMKFPY